MTKSKQKIIAGTNQIGDLINGKKITGFGKTWAGMIPAEDCCMWGLIPDDTYVDFQYAYFNEEE